MNSSESQEQVSIYARGISHHPSLLNTFLQMGVKPAASYIMMPSSHISVFSMRWQFVAEGKKEIEKEKKISINLCYVLHITLEARGTHLKEKKTPGPE